jgi:hypothetical protein
MTEYNIEKVVLPYLDYHWNFNNNYFTFDNTWRISINIHSHIETVLFLMSVSFPYISFG